MTRGVDALAPYAGIAWILAAALCGVVLVDLALLLAWAVRRDAVDAGRREPLFARRWSLVNVWVAGQVVVALTVVAGAVVIGGASLAGRWAQAELDTTLVLGLALAAQGISMAATAAWFVRTRCGSNLDGIGLTPRPRLGQVALGACGGAALLVLGGISSFIAQKVGERVLGSGVMENMAEVSRSLAAESVLKSLNASPSGMVVSVVAVALIAPMGEELFFRGLLYNCASKRLGVAGGVVLSALMFALAHGGPLLVAAIFPMGVVLAVAYERTRSLWVPITMHMVNNLAGLVAISAAPR